MVKTTIVALMVLAQLSGDSKHPSSRAPLSPDSKLRLQSDAGGISAMEALLRLGIDNHVPMGIVLGGAPNLCQLTFRQPSETVTADDLARNLDQSFRGYRTRIENGVLSIRPIHMPGESEALLKLRLNEFHTISEPVSLVGIDLWMFIRAKVAPDQGTAFVGPTTLSAEDVPPLRLVETSVEEILNLLVEKRSGGIWIMDGGSVTSLSPALQNPFVVFSYAGEQKLMESSAVCSSYGGAVDMVR